VVHIVCLPLSTVLRRAINARVQQLAAVVERRQPNIVVDAHLHVHVCSDTDARLNRGRWPGRSFLWIRRGGWWDV